MRDDDNGGSPQENGTSDDSEQPGERVNDITPTNAPDQVSDSPGDDAENQSHDTIEDNQERRPTSGR